MAITYGFYNSVNHDRVYDAVQMSSIFDGIIGDGVYETIGDALMVKPLSGNSVTVGTGRAWFNHTWTLNDALYPVSLSSPNAINQRYDAIVLEVNEDTRSNSILFKEGTASSSPSKPALTNTETIHQYPLAYILRKPGTEEVTESDIENAVGTSACPFVIGVVKVMDIDNFVSQWSSQWNDFLTERGSETDTWLAESKLKFETWFNGLKSELDENQAANLQNQINDLQDTLNKIISGQPLPNTIDDNDGDPIQDYLGNNLEGGIVVISGSGSSVPSDVTEYAGSYSVTPLVGAQTLSTRNKVLREDIDISEIPVVQEGSIITIAGTQL